MKLYKDHLLREEQYQRELTWVLWYIPVTLTAPVLFVQVLSCNCIFTSFQLRHQGPLLARAMKEAWK